MKGVSSSMSITYNQLISTATQKANLEVEGTQKDNSRLKL